MKYTGPGYCWVWMPYSIVFPKILVSEGLIIEGLAVSEGDCNVDWNVICKPGRWLNWGNHWYCQNLYFWIIHYNITSCPIKKLVIYKENNLFNKYLKSPVIIVSTWRIVWTAYLSGRTIHWLNWCSQVKLYHLKYLICNGNRSLY